MTAAPTPPLPRRSLRPGRVLCLGSDLWVCDRAHPVAAVWDVQTSRLLDVVSWNTTSPPGPDELDAPICMVPDGRSWWWQRPWSRPPGPLLRVGRGGVEVAAWTDGLDLAAASNGVAWCVLREPEPVEEQYGPPDSFPGFLARVDTQGGVCTVRTETSVRRVHVVAGTVFVGVEPWRQDLDWLSWPVQADLPEVVTSRSHGGAAPRLSPQELEHRAAPPGLEGSTFDDDGARILEAAGRSWRLTHADSRQADHRLTATLDGPAGRKTWDLGRAIVTSAAVTAPGLALVLTRPDSHRQGPGDDVEVLLLDADRPEPSVLVVGGDLDVTGLGWPLPPPPVEVRSYLREVLALYGWSVARQVPVDDMSDVRARLVGAWPETHLEWTFRLGRRPGVRLRRRVALFDDLGRLRDPQYVTITLREDLDTERVPPLDLARDGVLDF